MTFTQFGGVLDPQGRPVDPAGDIRKGVMRPTQSTNQTRTRTRTRTNTKRGFLSGNQQPTAGATTGNPQYDALLKLQQQQTSLTDLERLRQQLLSGDSMNDAARLMQRGFISNQPRTFNLLG
jgi:hypothetical protein